jgi:GPN-loop GTPase
MSATSSSNAASDRPVAIVCVGMAGSGKTTFMQRINSYLHQTKEPPYVVNLDPAVHNVPFESNIDIRDSVNYKEVMKQYNLGPNGGILTSLNLFATKVDQIMGILEKRTAPPPSSAEGKSAKQIKHILVDTPGQIEVFVWSASGDILLNSFASSFPTVIAYIIDTPRSASTSTFMSNMLYACSILYKTKLPMILVFNKTDVKDAEFAKDWMTDFEAFQEALREEEEAGSFGGMEGGGGYQGSGYMSSLLNSMSLVLDEFYKHLRIVGVSSVTGAGVKEFFEAVKEKQVEFDRDYKTELDRRRNEHEKNKGSLKEKELGRLMGDLKVDGRQSKRKPKPETVSEAEEEDDDDEEDYDDDDSDDRDENTGLEGRYKRALDDAQPGPSNDDMSFMKYLHTSTAK